MTGDFEDFFRAHQEVKTFDFVDEDFAHLFWAMTRPNPQERPSI